MDGRLLFVNEFNHIISGLENQMRDDGMSDEEIACFFSGERANELHSVIANKMIESITESLETYLDEDLTTDKEDVESYKNHLDEVWGTGLQWMRNLYSKCVDICKSYHLFVNTSNIKSDKLHVGEALWHIHAKATLVYSEIICLLENGYPDGAFMHYRTLHELWAVATFINSETDNVARAFLESANNKTNHEASHYEWAKKSRRFCNDTVVNVTISQIAAFAHEDLQKSIKTNVSKSHMKRLYTFPNLLIHPSAKGIIGRTSENYEDTITVGRADTGLATPAINSSMMFFNITRLHLIFVPNLISMIGLGILNEIVGKKLIPAFESAEKLQKNHPE